MSSIKKLSGVALVSATATLILAGCGGSDDKKAAAEKAVSEGTKVAEVKCSGINSCKGTGACGGATHACAGQNNCKGQGWIKTSKADCEAKGGKIL